MRKILLACAGFAGLALSLSGCIYPGYRHHDGAYGGYNRPPPPPPGYGGGYEHPPPPPPGYGHPPGY